MVYTINPWLDFRLENTFTYPYDVTENMESGLSDVYKRELPWLLASLSHFGNLIQTGDVDPATGRGDLSTEKLLEIARLCSDEMLATDLHDELMEMLNAFDNDRCIVVPPNVLPRENANTRPSAFPDLADYDEIIFFYRFPPDKYCIYHAFATPGEENKTKITVEGYFIGAVEIPEADQFLLIVFTALRLSFTLPLVIWNRRVHVPVNFTTNNHFFAFLFMDYLQRHGNYLDISTHQITNHKFHLPQMTEYIQLHDAELGSLHLNTVTHASHPFTKLDLSKVDKKELKLERERLLDLKLLGWAVIDVVGDGNCGYYSFLLGLENVGIMNFYVDTSEDRFVPMKSNVPWQEQVLLLRETLERHSRRLLATIYHKDKRDVAGELMWLVAGVATDEEIDGTSESYGLSDYFVKEDFRRKQYFNAEFGTDHTAYHMQPYWAAHVLASLYQLRVILYVMNASETTYSWSLMSFEYKHPEHSINNPHVQIEWITDLNNTSDLSRVRISDMEFRRVSTIEILYQTGFLTTGAHNVQHFQFLRRVIYSGVSRPPEPSSTTLRTELEKQDDAIPYWVETRSQGTPEKIHAKRKRMFKKQSRKRQQTLERRQSANDTRKFNEMCWKGLIPATRMIFDSSEHKYFICNLGQNEWKEGEHVTKMLVEDIRLCHELLVEKATRSPDRWVGPTIADSGEAVAPPELCTNVPTIYQQHNRPFCLTYSLASALFYCGFKDEAQCLAEGAEPISTLDFDAQNAVLMSFMRNLVPLIGRPMLFGIRTKSPSRIKRNLTWEELFTEFTIYPTIVVPIQPNGICTHAFCVVDDLIFDSITTHALKLREESVKWIFNDADTKIYYALRFKTKWSPEGMKVKGQYSRTLQTNWKHAL